ncbi:hypothetical protein TcasGA2_TC031056 [Tribolium castaneum]|uniref:Uncharacterized protein n=1 Tax=Tribolium castaneum TaxID=7070 RepID=A0A139WKU4_TRICA|nr:hypothetical protein TcasGA2_TC031056 [Tribolium castaneum]
MEEQGCAAGPTIEPRGVVGWKRKVALPAQQPSRRRGAGGWKRKVAPSAINLAWRQLSRRRSVGRIEAGSGAAGEVLGDGGRSFPTTEPRRKVAPPAINLAWQQLSRRQWLRGLRREVAPQARCWGIEKEGFLQPSPAAEVLTGWMREVAPKERCCGIKEKGCAAGTTTDPKDGRGRLRPRRNNRAQGELLEDGRGRRSAGRIEAGSGAAGEVLGDGGRRFPTTEPRRREVAPQARCWGMEEEGSQQPSPAGEVLTGWMREVALPVQQPSRRRAAGGWKRKGMEEEGSQQPSPAGEVLTGWMREVAPKERCCGMLWHNNRAEVWKRKVAPSAQQPSPRRAAGGWKRKVAPSAINLAWQQLSRRQWLGGLRREVAPQARCFGMEEEGSQQPSPAGEVLTGWMREVAPKERCCGMLWHNNRAEGWKRKVAPSAQQPSPRRAAGGWKREVAPSAINLAWQQLSRRRSAGRIEAGSGAAGEVLGDGGRRFPTTEPRRREVAPQGRCWGMEEEGSQQPSPAGEVLTGWMREVAPKERCCGMLWHNNRAEGWKRKVAPSAQQPSPRRAAGGWKRKVAPSAINLAWQQLSRRQWLGGLRREVAPQARCLGMEEEGSQQPSPAGEVLTGWMREVAPNERCCGMLWHNNRAEGWKRKVAPSAQQPSPRRAAGGWKREVAPSAINLAWQQLSRRRSAGRIEAGSGAAGEVLGDGGRRFPTTEPRRATTEPKVRCWRMEEEGCAVGDQHCLATIEPEAMAGRIEAGSSATGEVMGDGGRRFPTTEPRRRAAGGWKGEVASSAINLACQQLSRRRSAGRIEAGSGAAGEVLGDGGRRRGAGGWKRKVAPSAIKLAWQQLSRRRGVVGWRSKVAPQAQQPSGRRGAKGQRMGVAPQARCYASRGARCWWIKEEGCSAGATTKPQARCWKDREGSLPRRRGVGQWRKKVAPKANTLIGNNRAEGVVLKNRGGGLRRRRCYAARRARCWWMEEEGSTASKVLGDGGGRLCHRRGVWGCKRKVASPAKEPSRRRGVEECKKKVASNRSPQAMGDGEETIEPQARR